MTPDEHASPGEVFVWYALNHWGTGPGKLLPADASPGWHSYSDLGQAAFSDRLQLEAAAEVATVVTLVFVQRTRRLVVVGTVEAGIPASTVLESLWHALTPLAENQTEWNVQTTRVDADTYLLHPDIWPAPG